MANPLPNALALTTIADGAAAIAAPFRNNYAAIQAAVNLLRAALAGGTAGQLLQAADGTDVQWADLKTISHYLASGKNTTAGITSVSTTFAGGTDLLAAALSFTADGTSSYLVRVMAPGIIQSTATAATRVSVNMDGADAGIMANHQPLVAGCVVPLDAVGIITPAAGVHTINARLWVSAASTGTIQAGTGGVGALTPAVVSVEKL